MDLKLRPVERKNDVAQTNWSYDVVYYATLHYTNSSNLKMAFSFRPLHKKSINCNVKNKSAGQVRRDLTQVRPQHRRVKREEDGRKKEKKIGLKCTKTKQDLSDRTPVKFRFQTLTVLNFIYLVSEIQTKSDFRHLKTVKLKSLIF